MALPLIKESNEVKNLEITLEIRPLKMSEDRSAKRCSQIQENCIQISF
jgi:hypothetical protein